MNKIVPAFLFILFAFGLNLTIIAQQTRQIPNNTEAVQNVVPVQGSVPELEVKTDPTGVELKQQSTFNSQSPTKRVVPKQENPSASEKSTGPSGIAMDKNGQPFTPLTREQKMQLENGQYQPTENLNSSKRMQDDITYPDLQVTAIQDNIPPPTYSISECDPKKKSIQKNEPKYSSEIQNPETPTNQVKSGKTEFLKSYAQELKVQIEYNKLDPNYPLEKKQKELSDLEQLLMQE